MNATSLLDTAAQLSIGPETLLALVAIISFTAGSTPDPRVHEEPYEVRMIATETENQTAPDQTFLGS